MPKIKHLKKIHFLTHLPEKETKLYLGMLVMALLEEDRITLQELDEVHVSLLEGLAKKEKK